MTASIEEAKLLLDKGAAIERQRRDGFTPLMRSIGIRLAGSGEVAAGPWSNVEAKDSNGFTSLMAASGGGQLEMVKALLDHGANVNDQEQRRTTV